jgi:hypothetical protein
VLINLLKNIFRWGAFPPPGGNFKKKKLAYPHLQIWQRNINSHSVATWVLRNTLELRNILGVRPLMLNSQRRTENIAAGIFRGHKYHSLLYMWSPAHVYMVSLRSMESKRLDDSHYILQHTRYHPFTSFF